MGVHHLRNISSKPMPDKADTNKDKPSAEGRTAPTGAEKTSGPRPEVTGPKELGPGPQSLWSQPAPKRKGDGAPKKGGRGPDPLSSAVLVRKQEKDLKGQILA